MHDGVKYNCQQCDYQATQQSYLEPHKQSTHLTNLTGTVLTCLPLAILEEFFGRSL